MDELTLGIRAFQKSLYEEAYTRLLPLAEQGELRAQIIIARLYYAGNGVEKDQDKYIYWLQKAADSGDKSAKSQLKRLGKRGSGK
jgi:TPR repeat protein